MYFQLFNVLIFKSNLNNFFNIKIELIKLYNYSFNLVDFVYISFQMEYAIKKVH